MFIHIGNGYTHLLGKQVTWYSVTPIFAAIINPFMTALLAKHEKLDSSKVFRIALVLYMGVAVVVPLGPRIPLVLLPYSLFAGYIFYLALFCLLGKWLKLPSEPVMRFGVLSVTVFQIFSKLGCMLTGCCCGNKWDGPVSMIYGENTVCYAKNTPLFPAQLSIVIASLVLLIFALFLFRKVRSEWISLTFFFALLCIYYWGQQLTAPEVRLMLRDGFDYSLPMGMLCLFGMILCLIIYFKNSKTKSKGA